MICCYFCMFKSCGIFILAGSFATPVFIPDISKGNWWVFLYASAGRGSQEKFMI